MLGRPALVLLSFGDAVTRAFPRRRAEGRMPESGADRWQTAGAVVAALACLAMTGGCARFERYVREAGAELHQTMARPLQYRMAGADPAVRRKVDVGLERVRSGDHRGAVVALNIALWDVERMADRPLRLEELAHLHDVLAQAYGGQQRVKWADEQRHIAQRSRSAAGRAALGTWPQALARAKEAYLAARFPEALIAFRELLVDLEDVADTRFRLRQIEAVRCYLALTHWALGDEERVRDELMRLAALDATVAACDRESPPAMRALIADVQKARVN
jgi:hypothetical protein